jgi:hypothetical protein
MELYKKKYQESVENPGSFWEGVAESFYWQKKWIPGQVRSELSF